MRRVRGTRRSDTFVLPWALAIVLAAVLAPSALAAPQLAVTNTPSTSWERAFTWSVDESAPAALHMLVGDTGEARHVITPTATGTDTATISGTITIENTGADDATISEVVSSFLPSDAVAIAAADCNGAADGTGLPQPLNAGDPVLECTYVLSSSAAVPGTNVATVTCDECTDPFTSASPITFPMSPTLSGESASLTSSVHAIEGGSIPLNATAVGATSFGPFEYTRIYSCTQPGATDHAATATLSTVDGSAVLAQDTHTLSVQCDAIAVSRATETSYTRTYDWEIDEFATHTRLVLARKTDPSADGSSLALARFARVATVRYAVRAEATREDSGFEDAGYLDVHNPSAVREAHLSAVRDDLVDPADPTVVSNCRIVGSEEAGVDLGEAGLTIPTGATLRCDYIGHPASKIDMSSITAEVTAHHYPADSAPEPLGSRPHAAEASLEWGAPSLLVDERARVYSSHLGILGWAQAPGPAWFAYTLLVEPGAYGVPLCGSGAARTDVTVIGNDTEARGEDGVRIPARVLCFEPRPQPAEAPPQPDESGGGPVGPGLDPNDAETSTNATGRIDGVKNEAFPRRAVLCTIGTKYRGKRGGKKDPAWRLIGPKGQRTAFWIAGKKFTYARVVRNPGKGRNHRLARIFAIAKLYALSGSPVDARTARALVWSDRYFGSGKNRASTARRALGSAQAKKQRKTIAKQTRVLKRFNKVSKRRRSPTCVTATS